MFRCTQELAVYTAEATLHCSSQLMLYSGWSLSSKLTLQQSMLTLCVLAVRLWCRVQPAARAGRKLAGATAACLLVCVRVMCFALAVRSASLIAGASFVRAVLPLSVQVCSRKNCQLCSSHYFFRARIELLSRVQIKMGVVSFSTQIGACLRQVWRMCVETSARFACASQTPQA